MNDEKAPSIGDREKFTPGRENSGSQGWVSLMCYRIWKIITLLILFPINIQSSGRVGHMVK